MKMSKETSQPFDTFTERVITDKSYATFADFCREATFYFLNFVNPVYRNLVLLYFKTNVYFTVGHCFHCISWLLKECLFLFLGWCHWIHFSLLDGLLCVAHDLDMQGQLPVSLGWSFRPWCHPSKSLLRWLSQRHSNMKIVSSQI